MSEENTSGTEQANTSDAGSAPVREQAAATASSFFSRVSESVKAAFTGDEGSIFWAIGRLVELTKLAGAAINERLGAMNRAINQNTNDEADVSQRD